MVWVVVWSRVGRTESEDNVKKALNSLFPEAEFKGNPLKTELSHEDLKQIKRIIQVKKIGKTVWTQLLKNYNGEMTKLYFNKQAAFVGRLSLVEEYDESPMGAIVLEMKWDEDFARWLSGYSENRRQK